jgi:hypothetical protein
MKTVTYTSDIGVELTVKRPGGEIETVMHPTMKKITDDQFRQIQEGTAKAGRGEVLSYKNLTKTSTVNVDDVMTDADRAVQKSYEIGRAMTLNGTSK